MRFSKEEIRKLAKDDVIYYRGARYFRENAVSNVTWSKTNKVYRASVHGSNDYSVMVGLTDAMAIRSMSCNCPDYAKRKSPCKHIIATLLFISDYIERTEDKPDTPAKKRTYDILEYFNRQNDRISYGETYELKVTISIPSLLKKNTGKAFVSIRVGNNRFYKVQNLKKFLTDYYNKETISLGKEFKFLHGESSFGRRSQKILDYLMEVYEIQEALGRVYYSNIFMKSDMVFTKGMLIKLLELLEDDSFSLVLNEKIYETVGFKRTDPKILLHIQTTEEGILLDYERDYSILPLTDDGSLLLFDQTIFLPDAMFLQNFLPFYNSLGSEREPLVFSGDEKQKFLDVVLPSIAQTMELHIPDSMKERYIKEELVTKFYFDRIRNWIGVRVAFCYGEHVINPLRQEIKEGYLILRIKEKEQDRIHLLESYGFVAHKDSFVLRDDTLIYSFLMEGMNEIASAFEVYYSDALKTINIQSTGNLHAKVDLNEKLDLLELRFDFAQVPREELKELFHSLLLKKKYHRLKNGSFINLDSLEAKEGLSLLEHLQINEKNQKEDAFLLPKYSAFYLDETFDHATNIVFERSNHFRELVEGIQKDTRTTIMVPASIQAQLRTYQKKGFSWLSLLAEHKLGGILADDMGLGKTLESIVYMASHPDEFHLIVCPSSLVYNWQEEFASFAPSVRCVVVAGSIECRQELLSHYKEYQVMITSYPLIRRDYETYQKIPFHTMFIDEAQFIKNPSSQSAKAVKRIPAQHKFALTGTPIENSLTELWSIFDFVMPGFLLSHSKFVALYEKPIIRDENKEVLAELIKRIRPFVLRRMKKDVLKELPEKLETRLLTQMTEKQSLVYMSYMQQIKEELSKEFKQNGYEKSHIQILSALTRLRQICCHPATFIENYNGDSGKLELLMEQLPPLLESGHRVLIFSQFTTMLQIIQKRLAADAISCFYLDGSNHAKERMDMVSRFNEGERDVFLISLKAGGTGLNLTGADTVIHFDPWWNPAVEEQATDRAYRIGQTNRVQVIKLLTKDTIEEKIYRLQKRKREISDTVIDAREVFINRLSKEEIEALFQFE